ncbi:response regulator transcription factor [Actinocrispum sp. NPDC049592]|uniref:response regulator transcription factor n=1 Tax=Actinocrispum sp. NPDC049592 TaxID=3154835 RepID=UPI0034315EE2
MKVVIAEDSAVLRDGLELLLTTRGHTVAATVSTGDSLQSAVATHTPDIAVVDVRMPPTFTDEGIRAALDVRRAHPSVGLLVFSQHVETRYAAELLAGGTQGVGYLLKDRVADTKDFLAACEQIASGGTVLDPEVVTQILGASRRATNLAALTTREREVLALMAEGRTNTAIARTLFIGDGSVEKHISNIFAKLGLPPSESDHRRVLAVLRYLS